MEQNGFGKIQKRQGAGIWLECSEEERQNLEKYLAGEKEEMRNQVNVKTGNRK